MCCLEFAMRLANKITECRLCVQVIILDCVLLDNVERDELRMLIIFSMTGSAEVPHVFGIIPYCQ